MRFHSRAGSVYALLYKIRLSEYYKNKEADNKIVARYLQLRRYTVNSSA